MRTRLLVEHILDFCFWAILGHALSGKVTLWLVLGIFYWVLGIFYWVLGIDYWVLGIDYGVLGIDYWVLGIRHHQSIYSP